MKFIIKIKNFFKFIMLSTLLILGLFFLSVYEEASYTKECQNLNLECSQGFFANSLEKIKKAISLP